MMNDEMTEDKNKTKNEKKQLDKEIYLKKYKLVK